MGKKNKKHNRFNQNQFSVNNNQPNQYNPEPVEQPVDAGGHTSSSEDRVINQRTEEIVNQVSGHSATLGQKIGKNRVLILVIILLMGLFLFSGKKEPEPAVDDSMLAPTDEVNESVNTDVATDEEEEVVDTQIQTGVSGNMGIEEMSDTAKFNEKVSMAREQFVAGDYDRATIYYHQALEYKNSDVIYSGLFAIYNAQGEVAKAKQAIDTAIALNPSFTDHWVSKLSFLDEKTDSTFADLQAVYEEGMNKVDPATQVNLVLGFTRIAESNGAKDEAIALWEKAIELFPDNTAIYQAEIDRLRAS